MYQPPTGFLQDARNHSVHGSWFNTSNLTIPACSASKSAFPPLNDMAENPSPSSF